MSWGARATLLGGVSVLAAGVLGAGAAQAQAAANRTGGADEEVTVGEVLVTARKREERLRDVPVAATVLDVESLQARGGVSDVQTLLSTVSGLRYFNTSTPANSEISLRGGGHQPRHVRRGGGRALSQRRVHRRRRQSWRSQLFHCRPVRYRPG